MTEARLFDLLRQLKRRWTGNSRAGLSQAEVNEVNEVLADPRATVTPTPATTVATAMRETGIGGKAGPLAAIVGSVAAMSLFASVPKDEGVEYRAYRDIAGIWTVCAGDTNDVRPGLIETPEGCRQRLERQLVAHARPVMACTPALSAQGRDWQRAAAVSLAYNIGVGAWCRSTADKRFDRGDWRGGCDAFLSWSKARVGGQLRVVKGLLNRRQRERALCLKGLA